MNLPKRKPTRLKNYDYSSSGAYFITICTKNKEQLLSSINVGDGVLDVPQNTMTSYGKVADCYINKMSTFYNYIAVEKYVIMPNHIHMVLTVKDVIHRCAQNGTSRTPSPTDSIIAKFVSTFKRFCNGEYGENIWQRSYHDHIIRGENDYQKIWEYIDTNVLKWEKDCFYCQ